MPDSLRERRSFLSLNYFPFPGRKSGGLELRGGRVNRKKQFKTYISLSSLKGGQNKIKMCSALSWASCNLGIEVRSF